VVHGAHLFYLSIDVQVGLEPVMEVVSTAARNGTKFSQCNMAQRGFPGVRVQDDESLMILVGAFFPSSVAPTSLGGFWSQAD
jgi:hypothetical protein